MKFSYLMTIMIFLAGNAVAQKVETAEQPSEVPPSALSGEAKADGSGFKGVKQYEIAAGDTLWSLAQKYYGDPYQWRRIYDANSHMINDPHWIYPPHRIIIPGILEEVPIVSKPEPPVENINVNVPGFAIGEDTTAVQAEPETVVSELRPEEKSDQSAAAEIVPEDIYSSRKTLQAPDISDDMPEHMTGGYPSLPTRVVEKNWSEDGKVVSAGADESSLAVKGEIVMAKMGDTDGLAAGDFLNVFRKGNVLNSEDGGGLEVQKVAVLKVTGIDGSRVYARIVEMHSGVERGDLVKRNK